MPTNDGNDNVPPGPARDRSDTWDLPDWVLARIAERAPRNFDTDAHPDWVPLDTLSYETTSDAQVFRIRALRGDAVSAWSDPV